MIITLEEILYILVLTLALGYIFAGYIRYPVAQPVTRQQQWKDIKFAAMISAPAVILHEMGHKFVAMAFGLPAVFKIFWPGLGIGVFLRLINSPFLIIAPGYVTVPLNTPPLPMALVAFAGPFVNLVLWLGSAYYLKTHKRINKKLFITLLITKRINMILFIFNMIPIPPFDGSKVLSGIIELGKTAF